MYPHSALGSSMKRQLLMLWRAACCCAFCRHTVQSVQCSSDLESAELKMALVSSSECRFSRNMSLVCWTKINLLLLNGKSWEASCCLFYRTRGCCLAVGAYGVLTQSRGTQREVFLKDGGMFIAADRRQFCSVLYGKSEKGLMPCMCM